MVNEPKKPEAEEKQDGELDENELDNVSGGTAAQVSPELKKALQNARSKPMG